MAETAESGPGTDPELNQVGGQVSQQLPETQQTAPGYEEQFTAFIDFLGFSEVSKQTDDTTRLKVLDLLLSLSALRSEFNIQSELNQGGGTRHQIRPAISTFSDHIVISFPLERIARELGSSDDALLALVIAGQFGRLLRGIAAAALRLGLLIRGGATIGKLYHSQGVVFGEAMIEAYEIESRIAIYPRVVLSQQITSRPPWAAQRDITICNDGLHHLDYFKMLVVSAAAPGDDYAEKSQTWFRDVVAIVSRKLIELQKDGRLNELAKWTWFSREFRRGMESLPSELLGAYGLSVSELRW
jgi:hypothetical protein